jgi:hypothetical protein
MSAPELHDAELSGIRHDAAAKTVECVFRRPGGQYSTLVLEEIEQFRCTDFGRQNVVLQLIVHGVNETLLEDELRSHVAWMSATADGEQLANPAEIDAVVKRVLSGVLLLIVLVPSWGAQLTATANRISWR